MIDTNNSLFLIIDIQEKLVNMLKENNIVKNVSNLAKTCNILNVPTFITEQYPKGLGETVIEIKNVSNNLQFFEKTTFSAIQDENLLSIIKESRKKKIFICGIETHICVLQTAEELINLGYEVYLIKDACGSRKKSDYKCAISYAKQINIKIITTEMAIFSLLKSSKHPNFKEIQQLIK